MILCQMTKQRGDLFKVFKERYKDILFECRLVFSMHCLESVYNTRRVRTGN